MGFLVVICRMAFEFGVDNVGAFFDDVADDGVEEFLLVWFGAGGAGDAFGGKDVAGGGVDYGDDDGKVDSFIYIFLNRRGRFIGGIRLNE